MRSPPFSRSDRISVEGTNSVLEENPGYGCSVQHPGFSVFLCTALMLAILPAGCSDNATRTPQKKEDTPYTRKVSSSIRDLVERMTADSVQVDGSEQAAADLSRRYSTAIVKVDDRGRIQCYISLDPFERSTIDSLRTLRVVIEREETTLSLVQGWIPYRGVQRLSQLSCVRRIRPPDYPAPR